MSTAVALRPIYAKETRALLPILAGGLVAMLLAVVPGPLGGLRANVALLAYVLGAVALGATSVGHEYSSRTIAMYLAAPWSRLALFRAKAGALITCLVVHVSAAWVVYANLAPATVPPPGSVAAGLTGLWYLPVAMALCVAPALTMLFRGALAGVVFTLAMPMSLWLAAMLVTAWQVGANEASQDAGMLAALHVLWYGGFLVVVVFAPGTWWLFRRLEALTTPLQISAGTGFWAALAPSSPWRAGRDSSGTTAALPRRPRRPLLALLFKELRLQQTSVALAVLFVVLALVTMAIRMEGPVRTGILQSATILYLVLMAVMIGALTSAEERDFGVIEAQALMPLPAWQSTFVKLATALGLLLTLAIGLSIGLAEYGGYEIPNLLTGRNRNLIDILVIITLSSAYVSSISRGGLKAILVSMPVLAVATTVLVLARFAALRVVGEGLDIVRITQNAGKADAIYQKLGLIASVDLAVWWLAVGMIAATLMALFHRNHRTTVLEPGRLRRQFAWIALSCLAGATLVGSAWPVTLWFVSTR